jgi:hypothetical protein
MTDADPPLGRALRTLLVAADQRCPAIIGQAHLLYLGSIGRDRTAATLAQLERDAADLLQAIADARSALSRAAPSDA